MLYCARMGAVVGGIRVRETFGVATPGRLHFSGKAEASVFAWAPAGGGRLCLRAEGPASAAPITVVPPRSFARLTRWGEALALDEPGVWELRLGAGEGVSFGVEADGGAYPFVVPAPGVVPSHFPQPPPARLFDRGAEASVWIPVPDDLPTVTPAAWMPPGHPAELTWEDGKPCPLTWRPEEPSAYRIAEVDAKGRAGWWHLRLAALTREFRLTVLEGLPLLLAPPPPEDFPYARVICSAKGDGRASLGARFEYFRSGRRLVLRDQPPGESAVLHVLPGECVVRASRGMEFRPAQRTLEIGPGRSKRARFRLRRVLRPQAGWVSGDLHLHSCFADGGQTPRAVARAGRAAGLGFLFLTDRPEPLADAGLGDFNQAGEFLALPGEEAAIEAVHMNLLNTRRSVVRRGSLIADWLDDAAAQAAPDHPTAAMLNHPAHLPEVQRRHEYFRSWWVADEHESVALVENFDFASWFERLNRGRRLTGLWTTDSHDAALLPPGRKRTYVYVGDELTEASLIAALRAGRCFCTRAPGAILTLAVNGAGPGRTARPDNEGAVTVEVSCSAACPIERVELIVNGDVAGVWPGGRQKQLAATSRLKAARMRWLLARAFLLEPPWPPDGHTMGALMASGCAAFTNPVWVEQGD